MADVSTENSDGMHKIKLSVNDTEVVCVKIGIDVLGKPVALGGESDWMGQVTDYLKSAVGLDKLLGSSSSKANDNSAESPSVP